MVFRSRKGAENVVASLILFIAVMALATATTIVFKNYIDKSQGAVQEQQRKNVDVMKTSFSIALATYDGINTTHIYVKNTGSTRFAEEDMDVYIDGLRIPRNTSNRTIDVTSDTDTTNANIWDPGEELEIQVFKVFSSSQTHEVLIAAPNGVTDEEEFSS